MAKVTLNKRSINALPPASKAKGDFYWDDRLSGFGLIAYPSGKKTFFIEYGPKGKRRWMTIGAYGVLTPDEARKRARRMLAAALDGTDPAAERDRRRDMRTFGEWADEYLDAVKLRKKSAREDVRYLGYARKQWENRPLDSITADDVRRFMQTMNARGRITANRWLASVRACLAEAWRLDLIPANPASKVKPNRENEPRSRVLSDDEMRRVLVAIAAEEDPHVRAAFSILIQTGARVTEVLRARWEDLDLADRKKAIWRLPSPKAGKPQVLPLAIPTVTLLRTLPRSGEYIVAGRSPGKPRSDLKRPWVRIRERAELDDVHIHDLRRTFGLAVTRAAGLHVASKLLRHSDIRVTERVYAPLGIDDLRAALEQVNRPGAKVIPIKTRKNDVG